MSTMQSGGGRWANFNASIGRSLFSWTEPKAFRVLFYRYQSTMCSWWKKPAQVILIVSLGCVASLNSSGEFPYEIIPILFFAGILVAYGQPWLRQFIPEPVYITKNGMWRRRGEFCYRAYYSKLSGYHWLCNGQYYTLELFRKKERPLLFGVPDETTKAKIDAVLKQAGLGEVESGQRA